MNRSCVSVIIPAYNRAGMICEAIDSVLAQTCPALEIIVVDDGSIDNTEVLLAENYKDKLRYIKQKNSGSASARNNGIRQANGEWIAFLDSDDKWLPEKLALQMDVIKSNPEAKLIFTGTETRDSSLHIKLGMFIPTDKHRNDAFINILTECYIKTSSVILHRDVFQKIGFFNEELRGAQDWELFARIVPNFPVDYVPIPCVLYRKHPGSIQFNIEHWVKYDLMAMDSIFSMPEAHPYKYLHRYHKYRIYSEAGMRYFYLGDHTKARKYFLKSMGYKHSLKIAAYVLKTYLPASLLASRRNLFSHGVKA